MSCEEVKRMREDGDATKGSNVDYFTKPKGCDGYMGRGRMEEFSGHQKMGRSEEDLLENSKLILKSSVDQMLQLYKVEFKDP